ncbi:4'-phosphopantetheinyl transferase superfamily protein [Olivibacter sp. CPCC 100613]|uniref:4'-phosphopantetheinyl transferase family protein n=1 Tax=Olivibacter sp. CPCC 100613 TaxID=3079931 RepID=UPI002FFC4C09
MRSFYDQCKAKLPVDIKQRYDSFINRNSADAFLVGRLLLNMGLLMNNSDIFQAIIHYGGSGKPYLEHGPFFNISHSGDMILCGMSNTCEIGIDIERKEQFDFNDFRSCFTAKEWECIENSTSPMDKFFWIWTRKEAVIKADGRGLNLKLSKYNVIDHRVFVGTCLCEINELSIDNRYYAHVASVVNRLGKKNSCKINMVPVSLENLLKMV